MKTSIQTPQGTVVPGTRIRIIHMDDNAPSFTFSGGKDPSASGYNGKEGTVTFIDDCGQLHGTWGGLAVNPEIDKFEIL